MVPWGTLPGICNNSHIQSQWVFFLGGKLPDHIHKLESMPIATSLSCPTFFVVPGPVALTGGRLCQHAFELATY